MPITQPIILQLGWSATDPIEMSRTEPTEKLSMGSWDTWRWVISAPENWEALLTGLSKRQWVGGFVASPQESELTINDIDPWIYDLARAPGERAPLVERAKDSGAMMIPVELLIEAALPHNDDGNFGPLLWARLDAEMAGFESDLERWGAGPVLRLGRSERVFSAHWTKTAAVGCARWSALAERQSLGAAIGPARAAPGLGTSI